MHVLRDIKRHLQDSKLQKQVPVVMSALALHHYELSVKTQVYRLACQLLTRGGRFVLTDLFTNDIPDCDHYALRTELHDVQSTIARFPLRPPGGEATSTLSEVHYTRCNKPMSLTLELASIKRSGFGLVDVVFRDGQLAVIVAEKVK